MVIATIAFDMGIDCPNIYCVHWGPSETIEDYICMCRALVELVETHNQHVPYCFLLHVIRYMYMYMYNRA